MQMKGWYKMDVQEIGWEGMDWINSAQDRDRWQGVVNMIMDLQIS
jgi:hypothetical protein